MDLEKLKYPIGRYQKITDFTSENRKAWIHDLTILPGNLEATVASLSEKQLDTPYRPDGWTVRQVVHHVADSHLNAFIRIKLVMTEGNTTIRPYKEALWAAMGDYTDLPISHSLNILRGLHPRMVHVFQNMTEDDFKKSYIHPEYGQTYLLDSVLALYSWHGRHHLAHITELKKREGWL